MTASISGSGHVDWDGIFRAFKVIGFDGYLGFAVSKTAPTTWRHGYGEKLAPDGDTFVAREHCSPTKC